MNVQVLLLSEDQAFALIEKVEQQSDAPFTYRDSAGIRQLFLQADRLDPTAMLTRYYASNRTPAYAA